jgi:uncharacterized protein (UPF0128 family)
LFLFIFVFLKKKNIYFISKIQEREISDKEMQKLEYEITRSLTYIELLARRMEIPKATSLLMANTQAAPHKMETSSDEQGYRLMQIRKDVWIFFLNE